jgi:hypothetical protein
MCPVGFGSWIRKVFSSAGPDEEAAKRDDYGIPDRGRVELERDRLGLFAETEGTQAAVAELEELEPPRDQAP